MRPLALTVTVLTGALLSGCISLRAREASMLLSAPIEARNEPKPRALHTALWGGEGMVIWGGMLEDGKTTPASTGGAIYYPATGKWYPLPKHIHQSRYYNSAVWTGIQMIIWGGIEGAFGERVNTGLMFDNEDDAWLDVTTEGAPSNRSGHTAIWTSERMIVWGGEGSGGPVGDGGIYDLVQDKWETLPNDGAPRPRAFHTAVWTGHQMLVWGGYDAKGARNDGARYDKDAKQWLPMSSEGAPSPRFGHTAIWTGKVMIVWGGRLDGDRYLGDGAIYDPKKDKWSPLPAVPGLAAREMHTATWTGKEMVIFGGMDKDQPQAVNGIYNPKTHQWRTFRLDPKYQARYMHSAVWTNKNLIVWGGRGSDAKPLRSKVGLVISLVPGKAPTVVKEDDSIGSAKE